MPRALTRSVLPTDMRHCHQVGPDDHQAAAPLQQAGELSLGPFANVHPLVEKPLAYSIPEQEGDMDVGGNLRVTKHEWFVELTLVIPEVSTYGEAALDRLDGKWVTLRVVAPQQGLTGASLTLREGNCDET